MRYHIILIPALIFEFESGKILEIFVDVVGAVAGLVEELGVAQVTIINSLAKHFQVINSGIVAGIFTTITIGKHLISSLFSLLLKMLQSREFPIRDLTLLLIG